MLASLLERCHPLFLVRHRYLVLQLTRRDVLSRYKGSVLGVGWALLYPLLILASYTFVFRLVFKARWPGGADSTQEFALQVFAGLVVFNLFADVLNRSPRLVMEQPNLVKRVVFPLEVLPWVALGGALFHAGLGLLILLASSAWSGAGLTPWALLVPLVFATTVPFLLGIGWLLGGLGVFLRDIGQAMGPVVTMLMFMSPVLYPAKSLPPFLAKLLWLNPLTLPIENLRRITLEGQAPEWGGMALYTLAGLVFATLSWRLFERVKPAFADEV
jgi:lipopolysaccharide transport system permease protein